jgi:hypothetical protein
MIRSIDSTSANVRKRCVVYFSGFDPGGPRKYHALYTQESAKSAAQMQASVEVGKRAKLSDVAAKWDVRWTQADASTETEFVFARWDDIISAHWLRDSSWRERLALYAAFARTHAHYLRSGAMLRMLRLARPPVLALAAPLALVGAVAGLASIGLVAALFGFVGTGLLGALGALLLGAVTYKFEAHWHSLWLARSFNFTRLFAAHQTPSMEARLDALGGLIAAKMGDETLDELIVVGHSSGAMFAGMALARALRSAHPPATRLGYLTLGQWWPLLTCLPNAQGARQDLATLGQHPGLTWLDVSAATDGCCFAFIDPLRTLDPNAATQTQPKLASARWHTLFDAGSYAKLKSDRFALHFQYIHAAPKLGDADFYRLTAGQDSFASSAAKLPNAA